MSSVLEALRSPAESVDVRWLREQQSGPGGYVSGYVYRSVDPSWVGRYSRSFRFSCSHVASSIHRASAFPNCHAANPKPAHATTQPSRSQPECLHALTAMMGVNAISASRTTMSLWKSPTTGQGGLRSTGSTLPVTHRRVSQGAALVSARCGRTNHHQRRAPARTIVGARQRLAEILPDGSR